MIKENNTILVDRAFVLELIEKLIKAYRTQDTSYVMLETEENKKPKIIMFNQPEL